MNPTPAESPWGHLALSDNGFLLDTRTGRTFTLSKTGTFLMKSLINGAPPDQLPGDLLAHYEVDQETASRDVERFMFRVKDLGLSAAREEG
ncbi:MAG: PqqD family peptide modification chaperone [Bradymonadia bacterium]